jgi:hypothetical protein
MSRPARNIALALLGAVALAGAQAVTATADENLGVQIITQAQGSGYTNVGETDRGEANLTAMYVDSSGAAHIAYTGTTIGNIKLCTIAAGGSSCVAAGTLQTDGTDSGEPVQSLKYLPDGNGSAVLAVGFSDLTSAPDAPFDSSEGAPWTETEVFQPDLTTGTTGTAGTAIGTTFDAAGQGGGDEIYIPDEDGLDIVGQWSDHAWPPVGGGNPANAYQFESFTSPSSDPPPVYLGVEEGTAGSSGLSGSEVLPGEWPAGVTELANGEVGVLAYYIDQTAPSDTNPELSQVGMYVQPQSGGSFSPLHDLGINGPVETDFSPGAETYLVNGVSSDASGGSVPEDLELYQFQGTTLEWLGTIGATDANDGGNALGLESEWDTMPPIYEDESGNLYTAWFAYGGDDACPGSEQSGSTVVGGCLMYREVGAGGVMGPKVVLSEEYGGDSTDALGDVDQIAANSSGAGWVLDWREPGSSSTWTLYATPLSAAATVPTSPTVTGTVTSVPLTCTGTGTCSLSVSLDSTAAAVRASAGHSAARSPKLLARHTFTVKAGRHGVRLRLALGANGKRLLNRTRSLRGRLVVTESLGLTAAKKQIYSHILTLQRQRTERAR